MSYLLDTNILSAHLPSARPPGRSRPRSDWACNPRYVHVVGRGQSNRNKDSRPLYLLSLSSIGEAMNAQVLRGSKQEITEGLARIAGEIREAIVFVENPSDRREAPAEDIFAEMESSTVKVGKAAYDREAIYTRMEGE